MRRIIAAAALAVASTAALAQSAPLAGVHGYGQIGPADLQGVRDGVAIKFGADFMKNLAGVSGLGLTGFVSRWGGDSRGVDITGTTFAGGATFDVPLPDTRFSLQGRAFLAFSRVEVDVSPFGGFTDNSVDLGLGIGGAYRINERLSVRVDYDLISADGSDADILTGGIGYRF